PCVGYVSKQDYRRGIEGVIAFLSGRYREIERQLERAMKQASDEQRFEDAARERNRLRAVRSLLERQRVANDTVGTLDAIAIAIDSVAGSRSGSAGSAGPGSGEANAQVSQVRDGVLSAPQGLYPA